MNLKFDKEHWLKDKEYFNKNDGVDLDVELMDKYKYYFFGFIDSPVDIYENVVIEAKSNNFHNEDKLRLYLDSYRGTCKKLILYCILRNNNDMLRLRYVIIPEDVE